MDDNDILVLALIALTCLACVLVLWQIIVFKRQVARVAALEVPPAVPGTDSSAELVKLSRQRWSSDKVQKKVRYWPSDLSGEQVVERVRLTRRFIDFDGTLVMDPMGSVWPPKLREVFCGKPLAEFLAEEPFIIETWNPHGAKAFFAQCPELPQPLLIIEPPAWRVDPKTDPLGRIGIKDLEAIGVDHGVVYDDLPVHVPPDCDVVVVSEF